MKKLLAYSIATALLLSSGVVNAEQVPNNNVTQGVTTNLTLIQAIEKALTNSFDMKNVLLDLKKAEFGDSTASKYAKLSTNDPSDKAFLSTFEGKIAKYVTAKQAELGHEVSQLATEYTKKQVEFKTKQAYYNVLLAQDQLVNAKLAKDRAKKHLDNIKNKFKLGLLTNKDVLDAEFDFLSLMVGEYKAEEDIKKAQRELNILLGLPLETISTLTDKVSETVQEIEGKSINEWVGLAKTLRPDYQQKQVTADITAIKLGVIETYYAKIVNKYKEAEIENEKAELDLLNTEVGLENSIYNALSNYELAKRNSDLAVSELEKAKEAYRTIQLQYENGLVTSVDVIAVQTLLNQAEWKLTNSKYGLLLAKLNFDLAIGK